VSWSLPELRATLARTRDTPSIISGDGSAEERALAHQLSGRTVRPAAVLILLTRDQDRPDNWNIVLTQRTAHLHDHAGQISFPGGRMDEGDADLVATALREAEEEIGINPASVEVLATLSSYVTVTAYAVTPVLAVSAPQPYVCDPFEVADVFHLPLAHMLDENNWRRDSFIRAGVRREYWAIPYRERYVWGATAGMLRSLKLALGC
jgi:8-oxo-dGTP pyrophosphatase MutT (NUDIX family)